MTSRHIVLMILSVAALLVALNSIRTGTITWRAGLPPQTRRENPRAFWALITACLVVAAAMLAVVVMDGDGG